MAIEPTTLSYDPNLPVYAAPDDMTVPNAEITQKPIDSYIDPATSTVEGRMTGILSEGNAFTELAKSDNARTYNSRGLLNTGNAVAGGTLAAMREARAIATPDALLYGDMSKMEQKTDQDATLNNQVSALENQQNINKTNLSAALTTHEQGGQIELQKLTDAAQMQRVEIDNMWKESMNFDQLDSQERQSLQDVAQTLGAELTGGIERLLRDTNVENKTEAIDALMTQYRSQMSTSAAIVNLTLTWD